MGTYTYIQICQWDTENISKFMNSVYMSYVKYDEIEADSVQPDWLDLNPGSASYQLCDLGKLLFLLCFSVFISKNVTNSTYLTH